MYIVLFTCNFSSFYVKLIKLHVNVNDLIHRSGEELPGHLAVSGLQTVVVHSVSSVMCSFG